jgi:hypothetical protein
VKSQTASKNRRKRRADPQLPKCLEAKTQSQITQCSESRGFEKAITGDAGSVHDTVAVEEQQFEQVYECIIEVIEVRCEVIEVRCKAGTPAKNREVDP